VSKKKNIHDEAKAPDAFLTTSNHVLHFVERHAKSVGLIVAIALVVGVTWSGYSYWNSQQESRASEAIYKYQAELHKAESKVREERAKKMQELVSAGGKGKKAPAVAPMPPADYAKDFAPLVDKVRTELKAQARTKAAVVASLNLSYFLGQQKQFKEALEVLEIPSRIPSVDDGLGGFWRMHMGYMQLENQKPDEAIKTYKEVLAATNLKAFQPEAMLKLGVAFEIKGDREKAKEAYQKLGREFPNSEASSTANQYLRLMELKSQPG